MTATLHITEHCLDRMAERLGIAAERHAIHAALMALPAIRAALDLGGTGRVLLPCIDATLVMQAGSIVTVVRGTHYRAKERGATAGGHNAGRRPDTWRSIGSIAAEIADRARKERDDG